MVERLDTGHWTVPKGRRDLSQGVAVSGLCSDSSAWSRGSGNKDGKVWHFQAMRMNGERNNVRRGTSGQHHRAVPLDSLWRPSFLYSIENVERRTRADRDNEQKENRRIGKRKYTNKWISFI